MSGRLVRRVLQEREASPQGPAAAAEGGLVVVEEEEEAASPRRVAARNPFDLLDDDDDEAEEDKVRSSLPLPAARYSLGFNWIPNCFPGLIAVGHASCARGAMPYLMTDKIGRVQVDAC
jgi:hypothetical protein